MELKLLRSFVAVARFKSFSSAARELNTVQPAISRHISDLERELNVSLFWRNTREVNITSAGEVLLQEALEIIAHEERARALVKLAAAGKVGRLRIGYLGPACYRFLPDLVREYSQSYPDVLLSLHEFTAQQQIDAFEKGQLDIGFSRPMPRTERENYDTHAVYLDQYAAFLPKDHRLVHRKSIALSELENERFVLFTRQGAPGLFNQIINGCRNAGFDPNVSSEPPTMQTVLTEVASGLGISIAPQCIMGLATNECESVVIKDFADKLPLEIQFKRQQQPPAIESFVQLAMEKAETIQSIMAK